MKRRLALVALLLAAVAVGAAACTNGTAVEPNPGQGVEWFTDFSEARELAMAENRPMMINFYTSACPACRKLDTLTFNDESVSAFLNDNFINVKSNASTSLLHTMYDIQNAVPTTVFTTSDGTEMGRILGFHAAERFQEGAQIALQYWEDNFKDGGHLG
jgi:thiol:disulfide interchange protein